MGRWGVVCEGQRDARSRGVGHWSWRNRREVGGREEGGRERKEGGKGREGGREKGGREGGGIRRWGGLVCCETR